MSDMKSAIEGFDEAAYLKLNPDIRAAVDEGIFSSGLAHYVAHGRNENRPGTPAKRMTQLHDAREFRFTGPVPPEALRRRVHGNGDLASFETIGKIVSYNIYGAIHATLELSAESRVLDFGCGCGRVLRYFHELLGTGTYYGTDIDEEAITWCQSHLSGVGTFLANQEWPPLPFEDGFFDFIFSISIFTHLPEVMQFAWLEELRRVTRPGGYLLLTTHGEELFPNASREAGEQFRTAGFFYSVGTVTDGLPDFYQTAYHANSYIEARWSRFFEIKNIIKKGIANNQDLILCRRPIASA